MRKGFTLLEIMLVMAIIGIGMISIVPLVTERAVKGDEQRAFFEELFAEHLKYAQEFGVPIKITGFKGSANILKYDGTRVSIPGVKSVQSVRINDEPTPTIEYYIHVYPDEICDYFEIETDKYIQIRSHPLLLSISKKSLR